MTRRPSTALRALRAFVALMTVWCTGCSGFDPLLDAMVGSAPEVVFESGVEAPRLPLSMVSAPSAAESLHAGAACQCTSCHAVTLANRFFAPLSPLALGPAASQELPLLSVGLVPLLPPPERAT